MAEADQVFFDSFSTPFDDYYFHQMGWRNTPAPKPIQPMPQLLRDVIYELEDRVESFGRSETILHLMEWDDKTRKEFARHFKRIRDMTIRDHRLHDFTLALSNAAGITCLSGMSQNVEEIWARLEAYVHAKKYQLQADKWVGLITMVDRPGLIHGFIVGNEPWVYDEELESLSATFPALPTKLKNG